MYTKTVMKYVYIGNITLRCFVTHFLAGIYIFIISRREFCLGERILFFFSCTCTWRLYFENKIGFRRYWCSDLY